METTNILAIISTLFLTNTTDHWPQKQAPAPEPRYSDGIIQLTVPAQGGYGNSMPWQFKWVDNTDADTKVVETTVTKQRLLSFEAEARQLTNVLASEVTEHYEVDWRRVRTNTTRTVVLDGETFTQDGKTYRVAKRTIAEVQEPTNWWEEVGYWTNELTGGHAPADCPTCAVWIQEHTQRWIGNRRNLPLKPEAEHGQWATNINSSGVLMATNDVMKFFSYFGPNVTNSIGTNVIDMDGGRTWDILSTNALPSLESLSDRYDMFRIEAIDSSNAEGDTRIKGRRKHEAEAKPPHPVPPYPIINFHF